MNQQNKLPVSQMNDYESIRRREVQTAVNTFELPDNAGIRMTQRILVLEDDVTLAGMLKDALKAQHLLVTVVSNGAEGLKHILTEDFNIILCDMVMPNFPGDMFYRAVERARPHLCKRFIFMTGHHGDRKIEQFIRGIRGLILWKPFQMHVLFEAIQAVSSKQPATQKPSKAP
jgi:DNA-binding response OmpR family regulator